MQLVDFLFEIGNEQREQRIDFFSRSSPVFLAKRIKGQNFHAGVASSFNHITHPLRATLMTINPGLTLPLSPTAIAIHDDGDMFRDFCLTQPTHRSI